MRAIKRFVMLISVILVIIVTAGAQFSYSMNNKRNHPELKWQVYHTENFGIVYHQGLETLAPITGSCAEQVYEDLSISLNIRFKERYFIFISDMDDISNGATVPFGYFFIWVNPSEYPKHFTGTDGWLRKVVAHEMVHALLMEKTKDWTSAILPISPGMIPRDVHEGMAQLYSGEPWGTMRGDKYMTFAVRDDNFSESGAFIDNGGLLYGKGFSRIRMLKSRFTDAEIASIFEHRTKLKTFSFDTAFKEVVGESYSDFNKQWLKDMNVYYNWREGLAEPTRTLGELKREITSAFIFNMKRIPASDAYVFTAIHTMDEPAKSLFIQYGDNKPIKIAESGILDNFSVNRNGTSVAFARNHYADNASIVSDVYLYDIKSGKERQLTDSERVSEPIFIDTNTLAVVKNDGAASNLYTLSLADLKLTKLTAFTEEMRIYDLTLSGDGKTLYVAYFNAKKQAYGLGMFSFESAEWMYLTEEKTPVRNPIVTNDGTALIYTSHEHDVQNLFEFTIQSGEKRRITNHTGSILPVAWDDSGKLLCITQQTRGKNDIITVNTNRVPVLFSGSIKAEYSDWRFVTPDHEVVYDPQRTVPGKITGKYNPFKHMFNIGVVPMPGYADTKFMPGVLTMWSDMLSRHQFSATLIPSLSNIAATRYSVSYTNRTLPFTTDVALSSTESALTYADTTLFEHHTKASIEFSIPYNAGRSFYSNHLFSVGYIYDEYTVLNRSDFYENDAIVAGNMGEPDSATEAGLVFSWKYTFLRPHRYAPADAHGLELTYIIQDDIFGSDGYNQSAYGELYYLMPVVNSSLYFYGSAMLEAKPPAEQKRFGVNDRFYFNPGVFFSDAGNRKMYVRGGKQSINGSRLLFNTLEWRIPLLGAISGHAFFESAAAWDGDFPGWGKVEQTAVYGLEANYVLMGQFYIGGGMAWDARHPGEEPNAFWVIRKTLPF